MSNKVLIRLIVPEIDSSFDIFVPASEIIWRIKKMLVKSVNDLSGNPLDPQKEYILLNKFSNQIYDNNVSIFNTDIRNATELILLSEKNVNAM